MGYPPSWAGVPPRKGPGTSHWGTPWKGHGTSGSIIGWRWGTSPLPSGGESENITSHHTMYVGSKKISQMLNLETQYLTLFLITVLYVLESELIN